MNGTENHKKIGRRLARRGGGRRLAIRWAALLFALAIGAPAAFQGAWLEASAAEAGTAAASDARTDDLELASAAMTTASADTEPEQPASESKPEQPASDAETDDPKPSASEPEQPASDPEAASASEPPASDSSAAPASGSAASGGRVVRIGYVDYDGFIEPQKDGTFSGYGADFFAWISQHTGWKVEYVFDSWEGSIESLRDGGIDLLCHAVRTPEREEDFVFSEYTVGTEYSILYVAPDDERYYYNDFSEFDGMRIALLRDSFQIGELSAYAKKKGFSYVPVYFDTFSECLRAIDEGKADGAAIGGFAREADYKAVCHFGSDPCTIMAAPENADLVEEMDEVIGEFSDTASSLQKELVEKYYGSEGGAAGVSLTREEAEFVASSGPIEVGIIPGRKPFSYLSGNGEISGITVDIMDALAERSGFEFRYVMMPAGMTPVEFFEEDPSVVLIAGVMTGNPAFQREPYLLTDHFYTDDVGLVCREGETYDLSAPDAAYRLAIPQSYMALQDYINSHYPQFESIPCVTLEECLDMVKSGEADFAAQNVKVLEPTLSDPHYEGLTMVPVFFMEEETGIVSIASDETRMITSILDKCIATLSEKEVSQFTVNHMVANGYRPTWRDFLYKFRFSIGIVAALILAVAALLLAYISMRKRNYIALEEKNRQLAEAVSRADSANEAKSQFLARMSHEIRTPLNAIVGLVDLARYHGGEPGQVLECLSKIDTSAKMLLGIINDVLDMSSIENGKLKIAEQNFSLRDVLGSVSTVYEAQCGQKGVDFRMSVGDGVAEWVVGDPLRLNQILLNLISNAFKFTPEGGSITVSVRLIGSAGGAATSSDSAGGVGGGPRDVYEFVVRDTGEGMTAEMQERLFRPFEQEGAETAGRHGGSGLGLSIAKSLSELMGGGISCVSEKNVGTTFTVTLPFARGVEEQGGEVAGARLSAGVEDEYDFGGRKVLLADDTRMNADILSDLLSIVSLEADIAENGQAAVEKFEASEPGTYMAILMDVQMPVLDGYGAARAIRESPHPDAATIPIIAMTANVLREDVARAMDSGMSDYISKPIDTILLYGKLKRAMGGREGS